ncbi:sulfur carrier protein ThiS [Pelagimonas varians]|uniref:Sulfur carrier protein ThiS n=1 Tax=Pelagimonas varians TaxID=696760 RepID=A0A238L571_9RHOB|nr:sulfur carrier protein ThiS [Pelagimonas varians]PYG25536.1 sulfur carrier protein [Pelagimonas varians]SMX50235.1 sulfur carrier protein ThiS [Pelagimonas varians]
MKLLLNGTSIDAQITTLADLLEIKGFAGAKVATAVNGTFVPAPARAEHTLTPGDSVEVLAPMQGG